jgi:hypothetical protein
MIMIAFIFPNAFMFGFEYFEETDSLEFNELNFYIGIIAISYRWRNDGEKIKNLNL